jgi:hypothetical protein
MEAGGHRPVRKESAIFCFLLLPVTSIATAVLGKKYSL